MSKPQTTLIIPGTGLGGNAKTMSLVAIADYLRVKGQKITPIDCDTDNEGGLRSFGHWFGHKANKLNLRDIEDCDSLLTQASAAGGYVLADFPANARGDISEWLRTLATPKTLQGLRIKMIAVGAITPALGSAQSVAHWMEMLGTRATYMITLNQTQTERVAKPLEVTFKEWFAWAKANGLDLPTIEIPNLPDHMKHALLRIGKLPSIALKDPSIGDSSLQFRLQIWIEHVHSQLDSTGLFVPEESLATK
jgi:hypothetical protein